MRKLISFISTFTLYVCLSVGLNLTYTPKSQAWGFIGHTYIGDLTWEYLSPEGKAWVEKQLALVDEKQLGHLLTWADRIRGTEYGRQIAPLHFANVPPSETEFDLTRDCPENKCVVGAALERFNIFINPAASNQDKAEAFREFVHWISDLHQPLHLGFFEDRGGNRIQVRFQNRGTNLHSLWDTGLIKLGFLPSPVELAQAHPLPQKAEYRQAEFLQAALLDWATDANQLAREHVYQFNGKEIQSGATITPAYIEAAQPIIEQQILLSAQRLAYFIELAAQINQSL